MRVLKRNKIDEKMRLHIILLFILQVLLLTTGCSPDKNIDTKSGITGQSITEKDSDSEEFYPICCSDYTSFSVNETGEKVGEFHHDKIAEILGLDDEYDRVTVITCSDKIAICRCYNAEVQEVGYYAVNEGLGKSTSLTDISVPYCSVDYYKGNFYFTYDNKEMICSIEDSLEYVVKEADLGEVFDKVGDKKIDVPGRNLSITRILDEAGYIIAFGSTDDRHVMIQKDGTVTELPQLDIGDRYLRYYDNTGIVYFDAYDDSSAKAHCIKLDTMEENEIPGTGAEKEVYTMKDGKLYWSILSEQSESSDILYERIYYAYDVESNTVSEFAKADIAPGAEYDIAFDGDDTGDLRSRLCICGDNIFIMGVAEDKVKWFRVDKEGADTSLADMDLTVKTVFPHDFDLAAYTWDKPILVLDHNIFCPIDRKSVGGYSEIILSDEEKRKYPKFAKYIEGFNAEAKDDVYESLERHGEMSEDGKNCLGHLDVMNMSVQFLRIDEHFATIEVYEYIEGGPHPNFGSTLYTVNLDTGKELELSQILNDDSRLVEGVKNESIKNTTPIDYLTEQYNGGQKDTSFDEFLTDVFTDVIKNGYFEYSLTEEGLMFSFDDYDIAPHGYAGIYDITLKYSDYPELVKKEYVVTETKDPEGFVDNKEVNETLAVK